MQPCFSWLSRIEYYQILWLNTIQGSRHRQTTKEDGESQYQDKKKSGFLQTIHNVPPYFFYFATEEREGQIQTGGVSVQEIPGTGHRDLCCTVFAPRAVTGNPVRAPSQHKENN
jgi:hypothetical protein